jgi:DNA helicase-2/ATP-dependent DNA helicase PcrA
MSEEPLYEPLEVTEEDISWATGLLQLPNGAFYGRDATDPRQQVIKSMNTIDVAACPGSGKTTLLVAKLAILAEKWRYRTRGICVVSHTNVARDEIESKLANTTAGRRLISYPHFVGTIHKFVNDFLAAPWLRSRGYSIKMIDTDVVVNKRWKALQRGTRTWLDRNNYGPALLSIKSPDFGVGEMRRCRRHTPTYTEIREVCRASIEAGYFCHDEMFTFAAEMIGQLPSVVGVLRNRFPLLFVDEAQDNSEEQSAILHRIFMDGAGSVLRQRFGDENQAIFDSMHSEEAYTDKFPFAPIRMELPNSHRFGQRIASLTGTLEVAPYSGGLRGDGPRKRFLASGIEEAGHTIFLFDDDSMARVLDAYGQLILDTFSEEALNEGVFVAVGQVHKDSGDEHKPRHVGHYLPDYDPEFSRQDPKPPTFIQYVLAGMAKSKMTGEAFSLVEKIAEGILRLASMSQGGHLFRPRQHRHRQVVDLLKDHPSVANRYEQILDRFALCREMPIKEMWDDRRRNIVREIAETLAETSLSGDEVESFLAWPDEEGILGPPSPSRNNIYEFKRDGKEVAIRVGSIHSVKGQTHTATLVLETFYRRHNLERILPWLLGTTCGGLGEVSEQQSRLKLHYVAMSRPTHLLCLAMKASTFRCPSGDLNSELIARFEDRGWRIQFV